MHFIQSGFLRSPHNTVTRIFSQQDIFPPSHLLHIKCRKERHGSNSSNLFRAARRSSPNHSSLLYPLRPRLDGAPGGGGGGVLVTCWSSIPQAIELNSRLSVRIWVPPLVVVKMLMPLTSSAPVPMPYAIQYQVMCVQSWKMSWSTNSGTAGACVSPPM